MKKTTGFLALLFMAANMIVSAQNKVKVIIHSKTGYEGYETFADAAQKKLEDVFNSEKFKQAILNGQFTNTRGFTNQQLYDLIIKAHETAGPGGQDNVVDLNVRILTRERDGKRWMRNCRIGSRAGTYGVDGAGDGVTAICPQRLKLWFDTGDTASLAGHYAHEYMHLLGFSHNGIESSSFVYSVGNIVERLIREGV